MQGLSSATHNYLSRKQVAGFFFFGCRRCCCFVINESIKYISAGFLFLQLCFLHSIFFVNNFLCSAKCRHGISGRARYTARTKSQIEIARMAK